MRLWHWPLVSVILVGCGQGDKPNPQGGGGTIDRAKYAAAAEPAGAKNVIEVRKEARDGEEVVVVGRIGVYKGSPFTAGRASFTIVDPSLKTCDEIGDVGCKTPWDY